MSIHRTFALAFVLLCLPGTAVLADSAFRCGGQLVELGASQSEVLAQCGEPTSKSVTIEDVRSGNQVIGKTQKSRWTYASYGSTRVLVFDADKLVAIE